MSRPTDRTAPLDVDDRLPAVIDRLAEKPGTAALYLYGSYGTTAQTPMSDIDLALMPRLDARTTLDQAMAWGEEIRELLGTDDASLTLLDPDAPIFTHKVLREGRRLACWDAVASADFIERLLSTHADYYPVHRRFLREYDRSIKQRFSNRAG